MHSNSKVMLLLRNIQILSSAREYPSIQLNDIDLDNKLELPPGKNFEITGIKKRYQSNQETASELAASAVNKALAKINLESKDIDCLVATSATMDKALPFNAAMVHSALGWNHLRTMTFDIGASCLSFLTGLDIMSVCIEMGRFKTAALVSSDISTFTVNYQNLREGGIFGDGAAAVIITKTPNGHPSKIISSESVTVSEGVNHCRIDSGGTRYHNRGDDSHNNALFQMDGRAVFALASRELPKLIDKILTEADLTIQDIDWVIPHQASRLALDHMAHRLNIPKEKMVDIFEDHGNQVGASLPTALDIGLSSGNIKRGEKILLVGTGAGLTMGGMVLEY